MKRMPQYFYSNQLAETLPWYANNMKSSVNFFPNWNCSTESRSGWSQSQCPGIQSIGCQWIFYHIGRIGFKEDKEVKSEQAFDGFKFESNGFTFEAESSTKDNVSEFSEIDFDVDKFSCSMSVNADSDKRLQPKFKSKKLFSGFR